jgi:hypothetical protein
MSSTFPLSKNSHVVAENFVISSLAKELRDPSLHVVYTKPLSGDTDANLTRLVISAAEDFCKRSAVVNVFELY